MKTSERRERKTPMNADAFAGVRDEPTVTHITALGLDTEAR